MSHPKRFDADGRYFHVFNRGLSRRPVFETRRDIRFFLSRVAYAVRRGEIEVLAYAVLSTHYHLLVRSRGDLSTAMQRIQGEYTRYYNRTRGRDGPLFRGRFGSKRVQTFAYFRNVFYYILENAVDAGLCEDSASYMWCSASAVLRSRAPKWLAIDVLAFHGLRHPEQRRDMATPETRRVRAEFVLRRSRDRALDTQPDSLDDLIAPGSDVPGWMRRNARRADGVSLGQPLAGLTTVLQAIQEVSQERGPIPTPQGQSYEPEVVLRAGLLRSLARLTFAEIGKNVDRAGATAKRLAERHASWVLDSEPYCAFAARIVERCLAPLRGSRVGKGWQNRS